MTVARSRAPLAERFRARVDSSAGPEACWPWTGGDCNRFGHGRMQTVGVPWLPRRTMAHRLAYMLANGPIPEGDGYHGTCVLHRCDNPSCCNPAHLFLGTAGENNSDRHAKGRTRTIKGFRWTTDHPPGNNSRMTGRVEEVRRRYAGGESARSIAADMGVSRNAVHGLLSGKTYARY